MGAITTCIHDRHENSEYERQGYSHDGQTIL